MPTSEVSSTKTAWVQVVRNDFRRVVLKILNTDGTNYVSLAQDGSTPPGHRVLATEEFEADDPTRSIWSYAPTAAVTLSVLEGYTKLGAVSRVARAGETPPSPPPPSPPPGSGAAGGDLPR